MEKRLEDIYKQMKIELLEVTVDKLVDTEERKYVKYAPNYQRNYIWSELKATNLCETIFISGIIPPLTVIKNGREIEIVDGRQRYESLLKFFDNKFKLNIEGLQKLKDLEGKFYDELAPNLRTLFKEYKMKIICYSVQSPINISAKDLERVGRDLFRRHNYGVTSLKSGEIERAKYCYDGLTCKFKELLRTEKGFYNKCIDFFSIGTKKTIEEREKLNLLLIVIRELLSSFYIPIIGEKNIYFSRKKIDKYYDKFIVKLTEKEQIEKLTEFEKIFEKMYMIKERLKDLNSNLQFNIQFFKSVYWMLSILYNLYGNEFYDFKIDKFCHYVQDSGINYFETYNKTSGHDTEIRNNYMKEYIEKQLNLKINSYIEKIKENKKEIIYKKTSEVSKDKDWYNPLISEPIKTSNETMSLKEIIDRIDQNRFIIRSEYQRGEVIDRTKASRVVESVILGIKLPPLYIYREIQKNGLSRDVVLDGQQRLIDILRYIGKPVIDQDYQEIKTIKNKYALTGLRELEGLNNHYYEYEEGVDSLSEDRKDEIRKYIFDVIRIDKKDEDNIIDKNVDFVDIFIRLNQNPCPIKMNGFEMWNSFNIINTISRIKEIAKYKAFKQYGNTMKEEEIVTILAYMDYRSFDIDNIYKFFKINLHTDNKDTKREKSLVKISIRNKEAITNLLEKMRPNSKEEKEFLISVNKVNDFVDKLKILSDNDEHLLMKVFNPNKRKNTKGDKNCFYITWLILQQLDIHLIQTYKKDILEDLKETFKLMQDMPKGKSASDFIVHVESIIDKYLK